MKIIVKVFHQIEKFPIFLKTTIKLTKNRLFLQVM